MWKSLARTAGFLAYFFITLEMLFMVTPFALYYYSAYAPLLSAPSNFGCCLAASVFSTPSLHRDLTQHWRSGLSYLSGRIFGGHHSDLLREIQQTRRGKERLLCACPSSPIFVSSPGRAWSAHRLASFCPAHHLYPYA